MTKQRKVVTVLFCDVAGSTALGESRDPEVLQTILARYFERMQAIVERHEGVVEKFIGDAVMAVFGLPVVHEDDALRALRAAAEMREALGELEVEGRIGVNTGEVVVGTQERLATGDAINVAARLEQAAAPGEILFGEPTYQLVRNAVDAESVQALALKGKAGPVPAYRLTALVEGAPALVPRFDSPFVGRARELARLHRAFEHVVADEVAALATVVGPAGIGKTRVAAEFVAGLDGRARVLEGRCLSYGEGITFWPLQEILRDLPERPADAPDPEQSRSTEETFWAYRKLFEALAAERPLVLLLEDIHWAEPTLLDLVEHIIEWTRDAPMLLLCLARPELLEERPGWPGERVELEPLDAQEVEGLMAALSDSLTPAELTRIAEAAEGNPLFAEQMVALAEENGREADVPPTIHGLLAARIDRLDPDERALFECATVVGKEFWRGALLELTPPGTEVSAVLQRLERKRLVRPEHSTFPGEDAFRFEHILVRDAGYAGISKERRADLHERFANWLEGTGSGYDEIVGYHLEQAFRFRVELRRAGDAERALASRAGTILVEAGQAARERGDVAAAANLFSRSLALLPDDARSRGELLLAVGDCLVHVGDASGALAAYDDALAAGRSIADGSLTWEVTLARGELEATVSPTLRSLEDQLRDAERAVAELETLGPDRGLARAWREVGRCQHELGRNASSVEAFERAATLARRAGEWHLERLSLGGIAWSLHMGPTPASEGVRRCEEILAATDDISLRANMRRFLYYLQAMLGNGDEARRLRQLALADAEELGLTTRIATIGEPYYPSLALGSAEIEQFLRRSLAIYTEYGWEAMRSSVAPRLALALSDQGRYEEAEALAPTADHPVRPDDYDARFFALAARARMLAWQGDVDAAESLVREAMAIVERTDNLQARAWIRIELAELLSRTGKTDEAHSLLEAAIRLAEEKESVAIAERARARLAELEEPLESASGSARRS